MQRTYSRKRNQRRSYPPDDQPNLSPPEPTTRPRKRQKIEIEAVASSEPPPSESRCGVGPMSVALSKPSTRASTPVSAAESGPSSASSHRLPERSSTVHAVDDSSIQRQPVKDLSGIFSFTSNPSRPLTSGRPVAPRQEGSVARRMLGRSRTESTITGLSSSDQGTDETSKPTTPRKLRAFASDSTMASPSARALSPLPEKSTDDVSSPPVRPSLVNGNVRTYAGKSRSFLVALPQSQAASMGMEPTLFDGGTGGGLLTESQEDDLDIRESYAELRRRWGVDESEDDPRPVTPSPSPSPNRKGKTKAHPPPIPRLPYGLTNDLKSITELRSKGETRRFLDEVGYLFEGLDRNGALAVRRGSAMEIVTKLCDIEFARRAKAADFLGRAWEVLREAGAGNGDKVLDTILAFYAALVARDSTDMFDLTSKPDFAATLHLMLSASEHASDPLWLISTEADSRVLKEAGMTKAEIMLLGNLHRLARKKSGLFDECDIISNRLLISHALVGVPPSSHAISYLPSLLRSLSSEINLLPARITAYRSGLLLFPPRGSTSYMDTPSFLHLDNCLRLLDSCLLGSWSVSVEDSDSRTNRLEELRNEGFAAALLALCAGSSVVLNNHDSDLENHRPTASKCLESALRVLISLTHDEPSWCRAVLDDDASIITIMHVVVAEQRKRKTGTEQTSASEDYEDDIDDVAHSLDRQCLALGLLTNLVQGASDGKHVICRTRLDFDCPGHRRCLQGCTCPSRVSSLVCLARVYSQYATSTSDSDIVIRGHMAVLFGLLMEQATHNQRTLLAALPGTDDYEKVDMLLRHAKDFAAFYVVLARKLAEVETCGDEEEEDPQFSMQSRSGRMFRDSMGVAVTSEVINSLSNLRDKL